MPTLVHKISNTPKKNDPLVTNRTNRQQTWWDAACACTPENNAELYHHEILNDSQWLAYLRQQDADTARQTSKLVSWLPSTPEERFMWLCFMHEFYADKAQETAE